MSRRGKWTLTSVSVLGIAALAVVVPSMSRLHWDGGVSVARVTRDHFVRRVYAEGHLEATEATPVNAPVEVEGPFKIAWLAPDGSRVKAGEVVVRFDPTEMEKNLADGKSDQQTAARKTEQRSVERDATLGGLSRDADVARLELQYAKEFQSKDPEIFSRTDIIESEIDEKLATRREASATGTRDIQGNLASADLALLDIDRRKAELLIEEARQGLQSLEITAPHDGILVFERDWRGELPAVGAAVWNGQPIAEIPNLARMEAQVYVLEADAGGLAVGTAAEVTVESHPEEILKATVKHVDALAKRKDPRVPIQYFEVTLELERDDPTMKPGQRVSAILMLDETEDALVIPRDAVFGEDDKKVVYVQRGWEFEPVEVKLGVAALGRVVIESGLEEGDLIALQNPLRTVEDTRREPSSAVGLSPRGRPR
jgi:RND family efflux transporter MFP subunit